MLEGDVLSRQKQFSRAAKAYENAYGITKSGALAIKLHSAYAQAGKPDEGDARLAQWLKESPNDNVARLYAAESDLKRGRYKEAIANYELLQQKQLNNIVLLNNLAWAYQQVKDMRSYRRDLVFVILGISGVWLGLSNRGVVKKLARL
jgi:Flp pilus assembly protein TadD